MYTFESRVRYSECDYREKLNIFALINYLQDCSTFHSENSGMGVLPLHEQNLVWVVSSWQIDISRFPSLGERITIGTFPYSFKGFFGRRNYFIKDEKGEYVVKADSLWTLLNYETSAPVKVTEEIASQYGFEEALDMDYVKGRIAVPKELEVMPSIEILDEHLDSNMHVNNGQYVGIVRHLINVEDYKRIRVEYRKMALKGEKLTPHMYEDEERFVIVLKNEEQDTCTVLEFLR
ncbi:MAG: thioesterase [Lachnospiraceae bacterium]|nr:thioesterase [Lachnospiraceae bacterium]